MSEEQVKEAGIIYDSGSDLLNLINEILDLAKIEAGRIELRPESQDVDELVTSLRGQFTHMASSQGLDFIVEQSTQVPKQIVTDPYDWGKSLKTSSVMPLSSLNKDR